MGLIDSLFGEFIDVIAWTDDTSDTLVWRFEREGHEIKMGAKLTVREGQAAVFVHEGQIADVFPPGLYKLSTNNLPILTTIQHWDHGFESPFKSEIYFVSTRRFTDLKWGTRNPVMLRDAEFGPIRLRAFGSYAFRVTAPDVFLREIVGTDGEFTTDEISNHLRNLIVSRFANVIATARIPALDLAANYDDLGEFSRARIQPEMEKYGVEITKLLIENISLPDDVEKALDRRSSMGVVGDLRRYAQFQAAEAMRTAAQNEGNTGAILGVGVGTAIGRGMADALSQTATGAMETPPPLPGDLQWHIAIDGVAQGPFTLAELAKKVTAGELSEKSLVWRTGMSGWEIAGAQSALSGLFRVAPPPLPGL
ncbi:MAG: SPFH domain-containing protein [Pseudomonadota bacterium]